MCGIAGILGSSKTSSLKQMLNHIKHRGPDDTGFYEDNHIKIGMNRLSIIDVKGGSQPIVSNNKRFVIVYNGEIYNFKNIKKELTPKYNFSTNSDTEVILKGFEEFGISIFNKLNGIFSVAIWDKEKKKLILARDVRGIKPLYYGLKNNNFYFSSELKPFYKMNLFNEVDNNTISQYLCAGYAFHPSSSLKSIKQLKPGEILEINQKNELNHIMFEDTQIFDDRLNHEISDPVKYVRNSLIEAVDRQMISDVEVGLLLSSGIDSMSILTALNLQKKTENLKTFTAYYPNQSFSENKYVESLSKKWGFKNYSFIIEPNDVYENLDKIFDTFDNLEFMPVCVSKYLLSKFSSKHVKVLLTGAGGDEIFSGYQTHKATNINKKFKIDYKFFNILKKFMLDENYKGQHLSNYEKIYRYITGSSFSNKYSHLLWRYIFNLDEIKDNFFVNQDKSNLLNKIYSNQIIYFDSYTKSNNDLKNLLSNIDVNTWLVDHALHLWDKAGMANSTEVRSPLLDLKFLNDMSKLKSEIRIKKIGSKVILKEAFINELPKNIINMPKKGFSVPVTDWIEYPKTKKTFLELTNSLPENFVKKSYVNELWKKFDTRKGNVSYRIWILACLAGWLNNNNLKIDC